MRFNNSVDKRKAQKPVWMSVDESGLAKSAAWAWYERGSGSEGREVDLWRSKPEPKPSRYKLEALRNLQRDQDHMNSTTNSLLDNYEIERISMELNHYIQASNAKHHGGGDPPNNVFLKRKNMAKRFWWRHVPACGSSRNDVVEPRPVIGRT
ncbi:uncharacterized protein LOC125216813 [Salvia hispanica]|uniref:uncharacterized protein LOC125216813 n=1 Tax=Salvia hispanica TaxID=49212 RepID=UPI002009AB76|nr:uncharacterized protein LOC125216813 [Salvia hispanica]